VAFARFPKAHFFPPHLQRIFGLMQSILNGGGVAFGDDPFGQHMDEELAVVDWDYFDRVKVGDASFVKLTANLVKAAESIERVVRANVVYRFNEAVAEIVGVYPLLASPALGMIVTPDAVLVGEGRFGPILAAFDVGFSDVHVMLLA
jgi:hypothetical protein